MAKKWIFSLLILSLIIISCSKDEEEKVVNRLNHVGDEWKIASVEYYIIEQSMTGQSFKQGTAENAGAFYFNGTQGTFNILVDKWHEEDYFTFSEDQGDVQITSIEQSVGGSNVSQSVISIQGVKSSTTTMTVSGSIIRQSTGGSFGQFVMEATFTLVKQ